MKVLQRLTMENLQKNKRRTLVTVVGVVLASALILAVAGMVTSFQQMMINYAKTNVGDYHDMYESVPAEDLKYIENNNYVDSFFYSKVITKEALGDDYEFYQNKYAHAPYDQELYEKLDSLPTGEKGAEYNIFVRYKQPKEYATAEENILQAMMNASGRDINVRTNNELLRYEGMVMADAALASLYSVATIVIGIIVVTSVFVIRNSFSISATERARQFGMLASIGATPRQIRHSVIFEGLVIAGIGIPLGMICGVVAVIILVGVVNYLLGDMIVTAVEFSMPLWVFGVAIILGLSTVLLASLMPAIRAARMSPIEAIRGNQDLKIKPKKLHSSKIVHRMFGIGGVIADKNIKRSRKKYRTTVISIVISVATFIGLSSFMGYGEKTLDLQFRDAGYDFTVGNAPRKLCDEIVQKFDIKDYAYYWAAKSVNSEVLIMNEKAFEDYAKSLHIYTKDYSKVAIMNDYALTLNEDGSYAVERLHDTKDGDNYAVEIYTKTKADGKVDFDSVHKVDLPITKITEDAPLGLKGIPGIYVSEKYYQLDQLGPQFELTTMYARELKDLEAATKYTEDLVQNTPEYSGVFVKNVAELMEQQRRMYLMIAIFLYGFVIVVVLIGITNIFNTITTNIALRSKEFAMLKSIGMTSHEFNRMIRLESLMYSGKALLIGLPLGLLLSFGFYKSLTGTIDFGFIVPWGSIFIAILAVGILIWAIMNYSVRQVEKQNIIEAIRDENI